MGPGKYFLNGYNRMKRIAWNKIKKKMSECIHGVKVSIVP